MNTKLKCIINNMDLDEKIGALLTLGFSGTFARSHVYESIQKYKCGGLRLSPRSRIFGNYIDPKTGKTIVDIVDNKGYKGNQYPPTITSEKYHSILCDLQQAALSRKNGIPLHFSFDQEGGTSADFCFDDVNFFPKPMGIRATGDPNYAYQVALAVCRQSRAVGFNWIHSPVLDVNSDYRNPEIYTRAYSDHAEIVAQYALEACKGFKKGGLIATGKHFPGRGHSAVDAHFEVPVIAVDKDTMLKRELLPYRVLIENDVLPSIMIAHSIFPAIDENDIATVSKKVLIGLLRDELGFDGVITTDSMTMGAVSTRYGVANACAMSIEAGADLVLMKAENHLIEDTINKIKEFIMNGRITMEELDKKVERVLKVKMEYGLFEKEGIAWHETPAEAIYSKEVIELSKTVAKKSIMLLKDERKCLPLSCNDSMLIVEQINKTPNTASWHPGIILKNMMKYNSKTDYLETAFTYDEDDKAAIERAIKNYHTVVITSFYHRGYLSNNEYLEKLFADHPDKSFVVITNTPFEISIPKNSKTAFLTLSTAPDNIEATVIALFGKLQPEGQYPLEG